MIRHGSLRAPVVTTQDLIERMAEKSGHKLEITASAAFLTVGRTTWVAPLPPAGSAL